MRDFTHEITRDGRTVLLVARIDSAGSPGSWGLPEDSEPAEPPEWHVQAWAFDGDEAWQEENQPGLTTEEEEAITARASEIVDGGDDSDDS